MRDKERLGEQPAKPEEEKEDAFAELMRLFDRDKRGAEPPHPDSEQEYTLPEHLPQLEEELEHTLSQSSNSAYENAPSRAPSAFDEHRLPFQKVFDSSETESSASFSPGTRYDHSGTDAFHSNTPDTIAPIYKDRSQRNASSAYQQPYANAYDADQERTHSRGGYSSYHLAKKNAAGREVSSFSRYNRPDEHEDQFETELENFLQAGNNATPSMETSPFPVSSYKNEDYSLENSAHQNFRHPPAEKEIGYTTRAHRASPTPSIAEEVSYQIEDENHVPSTYLDDYQSPPYEESSIEREAPSPLQEELHSLFGQATFPQEQMAREDTPARYSGEPEDLWGWDPSDPANEAPGGAFPPPSRNKPFFVKALAALAVLAGGSYYYIHKKNSTSIPPVIYADKRPYKVPAEQSSSSNDEESIGNDAQILDEKLKQKQLIDHVEHPESLQTEREDSLEINTKEKLNGQKNSQNIHGDSRSKSSDTDLKDSDDPFIKHQGRDKKSKESIDGILSQTHHKKQGLKKALHNDDIIIEPRIKKSKATSVAHKSSSAKTNKPAAKDAKKLVHGYYIQVASSPTAASAQVARSNFLRHYKSVIGGSSVIIEPAHIQNKGTFYRVRIRVTNKEDATEISEQLHSSGVQCFVGHS